MSLCKSYFLDGMQRQMQRVLLREWTCLAQNGPAISQSSLSRRSVWSQHHVVAHGHSEVSSCGSCSVNGGCLHVSGMLLEPVHRALFRESDRASGKANHHVSSIHLISIVSRNHRWSSFLCWSFHSIICWFAHVLGGGCVTTPSELHFQTRSITL